MTRIGVGIGVPRFRPPQDGASGITDPTEISELSAWWRADTGVTESSGVTDWESAEGNAYNFSQATFKPDYVASGTGSGQPNGEPYIRFVASGFDYMELDASPSLTAGKSWTILMVVKCNAQMTGYQCMLSSGGTTHGIYASSSTGGVIGPRASNTHYPSDQVTPHAWKCITIRSTGDFASSAGQYQMWVEGRDASTPEWTEEGLNTGFRCFSTTTLGRIGSVNYASFEIAELIILDEDGGATSDADLEALWDYVDNRYGLSDQPPNNTNVMLRYIADEHVSTSSDKVDDWSAWYPSGAFTAANTGTARPGYSSGTGPNSTDEITFDDTDDHLDQSSGTFPASTSEDYTFFAVVTPGATADTHQWLISGGVGGEIGFALVGSTSQQPAIWMSGYREVASGFTQTTSAQIVCFTFDRSTNAAKVYRDGRGESHDITLPGTGTYTFDTTWTIGNYGPGTLYFDGNMSELVLYDKALSAAEIDAEFDYLGAKYGITITDP